MGLFRKRSTTPPASETMEVVVYEGRYSLAVKGESNYQRALWQVVNEIGRSVPAILIPEPDNPYDSNAVAVLIAGLKVGYLAREDAEVYKPGLLRLIQKERGKPVAFMAEIWGGEPGKESLGVWLRHDPTDFGLVSPVASRQDEQPQPGTWTGAGSAKLRWFEKMPTDRLAAIKYLRKQLDGESEPLERHFIYNELEELLYKCRDVFASALQDFETLCIEHDREMEAIRSALVAQVGGVPFLPLYKQVAIMKHKARDYEKALWWAQRGLMLYGTEGVREDVVEDLRRRADQYRGKLPS